MGSALFDEALIYATVAAREIEAKTRGALAGRTEEGAPPLADSAPDIDAGEEFELLDDELVAATP